METVGERGANDAKAAPDASVPAIGRTIALDRLVGSTSGLHM